MFTDHIKSDHFGTGIINQAQFNVFMFATMVFCASHNDNNGVYFTLRRTE